MYYIFVGVIDSNNKFWPNYHIFITMTYLHKIYNLSLLWLMELKYQYSERAQWIIVYISLFLTTIRLQASIHSWFGFRIWEHPLTPRHLAPAIINKALVWKTLSFKILTQKHTRLGGGDSLAKSWIHRPLSWSRQHLLWSALWCCWGWKTPFISFFFIFLLKKSFCFSVWYFSWIIGDWGNWKGFFVSAWTGGKHLWKSKPAKQQVLFYFSA